MSGADEKNDKNGVLSRIDALSQIDSSLKRSEKLNGSSKEQSEPKSPENAGRAAQQVGIGSMTEEEKKELEQMLEQSKSSSPTCRK